VSFAGGGAKKGSIEKTRAQIQQKGARGAAPDGIPPVARRPAANWAQPSPRSPSPSQSPKRSQTPAGQLPPQQHRYEQHPARALTRESPCFATTGPSGVATRARCVLLSMRLASCRRPRRLGAERGRRLRRWPRTRRLGAALRPCLATAACRLWTTTSARRTCCRCPAAGTKWGCTWTPTFPPVSSGHGRGRGRGHGDTMRMQFLRAALPAHVITMRLRVAGAAQLRVGAAA